MYLQPYCTTVEDVLVSSLLWSLCRFLAPPARLRSIADSEAHTTTTTTSTTSTSTMRELLVIGSRSSNHQSGGLIARGCVMIGNTSPSVRRGSDQRRVALQGTAGSIAGCVRVSAGESGRMAGGRLRLPHLTRGGGTSEPDRVSTGRRRRERERAREREKEREGES
eukprot:COSAG01_NODE_1764_length_9275_cov_47.450087_2_plen_166_part_00